MKIFTILSFLISCFSLLLDASSSDYLKLRSIEELIAGLELEASREEINEPEIAAAQLKAEDDGYYSLASESSDAKNDELIGDEFEISGRWSNMSLKLVCPEIFRETSLTAEVQLYYGIDKNDINYSIAKEYIETCWKIGYKDFDPNSLRSRQEIRRFNNEGFDTRRSSFTRFREYVKNHEMPGSSPISWTTKLVNVREKWRLQRGALLNFAISEILERFDNIDVQQLNEQVNLDRATLDIVIKMVKEKVLDLFCSIEVQSDNFTYKLDLIIWNVAVDACIIGNIEECTIHEKIFESLMVEIWPVLDTIYNYDDPSKVTQYPDMRYPYFI